ncbi:MAG: hypothetical protein M1829_005970 [Trizodia sp. TS-e1964]|nr:MAG: hypothetical protein M1829_005970 [Trizodia sp. TS-e1964]
MAQLNSKLPHSEDPSPVSEPYLSDGESELSEARDIHDEESSQTQTPPNDSLPSDIDAEATTTPGSSGQNSIDGIDDEEYDAESVSDTDNAASASKGLAQSSGSRKRRKVGLTTEDYIQNDPALYGLRRSGRTRPHQPTLRESSEDESIDKPKKSFTHPNKRVDSTLVSSRHVSTTPVQSPAISESDNDIYVSKQSRASNAQRRGRNKFLLPPHTEVRSSTRNSIKKTYNEDSDEIQPGLDPELFAPIYQNPDTEELIPGIDVVLRHKAIDENVSKSNILPKNKLLFQIKWKGLSYYHSSWESTNSLSACTGLKKLDNYYNKVVVYEYEIAHNPHTTPEEIELWNLAREKHSDEIDQYTKVERIIAKRDGDSGTEYYAKWRGLNYDACTWETQSVMNEIAQSEIEKFLNRTSMKFRTTPKNEGPGRKPCLHVEITKQPSYIKHGELRRFQLDGLNYLAHNWCKKKNVILADEMGLGKTVQTIAFLSWLRHHKHQSGPFLVVVPLSTLPAWAETFDQWAPDTNYIVFNGTDASRKIIKENEFDHPGNRPKFHVLLTTYEYAVIDHTFLSSIHWQFMALDEAHRLKNKEAVGYRFLIKFNARDRLLLTGTPFQNNTVELSNLYHFLMPDEMRSLDKTLDTQLSDQDAVISLSARKQLDQFKNSFAPYMLRRTKAVVERDLPPKKEMIIRVPLADVQLDLYQNIFTHNYSALNAGASKGQKHNLSNIMMELRKASNHPFLFPQVEEQILHGRETNAEVLQSLITSSGKMMLLDVLLTRLKKEGHRVLIFSQMVKMLDILGDYLKYRGHQFQRLDGTMPSGTRNMAINHFNEPGSDDFCFLLSTRAGGLGINLMTADTVIIFDSDWNPQADLQAMARAHRIGQKKPVNVYRLITNGTVEEDILTSARNKLILEYVTIKHCLIEKKVKDAYAKDLAKKGVNAGEPATAEALMSILKERGQKMFEQSSNQKSLEELDLDMVLANAEENKTDTAALDAAHGKEGEDFLSNFKYTDVKVDKEWDEIIPKDKLAEIKAREKQLADEQYLQEMIEQSLPRKRKSDADREERAHRKRQRTDLSVHTSEEPSPDSSPSADTNRPLATNELRSLIRAFLRYGSFDERQEEIVRDANLAKRNVDVLRSALREISETSERLLLEEREKVEAIEKSSNKILTKKDKKAILFDHNGVKRLNAETIIERPQEMRMLKQAVEATPDPLNYRIPEATKSANYTCEWGAREDGMLCYGILKHGYGAWVSIRDDLDLGMSDKLFLEEHRVGVKTARAGTDDNPKSPGAVHLVRRADYLLSVIKDRISDGSNSHKPAAKKPLSVARKSGQISPAASPAQSARNSSRDLEKPKLNGTSIKRKFNEDEPISLKRRRSSGEDFSTNSGMKFRAEGPGTGNRHRPSDENNKSKYQTKRKAMVEDEDGNEEIATSKRRRSDDHSQRPQAAKSLKAPTVTRESLMRERECVQKIFIPLQPKLNQLSKANKAAYPDKGDLLAIRRLIMLDIGKFVKTFIGPKKDDIVSDEEMSLWSYAALYWPRQTDGPGLREMYYRMRVNQTSTSQEDQKDQKDQKALKK